MAAALGAVVPCSTGTLLPPVGARAEPGAGRAPRAQGGGGQAAVPCRRARTLVTSWARMRAGTSGAKRAR